MDFSLSALVSADLCFVHSTFSANAAFAHIAAEVRSNG